MIEIAGSFPKVSSKFYGYSSGLQIQNVGNVAATMTITLTERNNGGRNTTLTSGAIPQGTPWKLYLPDVLPSSWTQWDGSATVTASQNIVGMSTQAYRPDAYPLGSRPTSKVGDSNTGYNGINQ